LLGAVGSLTPNAIAMRALVELGPGRRDLLEVLPLLVALVAIGVVGLAVGSQLMVRRLR